MNNPTGIAHTLEQRRAQYGAFDEHARITQGIKAVMADSPNWNRLAADQREALEMVAHKMGRILNGNPDLHDSWHDISGYSTLVADRLDSNGYSDLSVETATACAAPISD